jgi:hypothetical protein
LETANRLALQQLFGLENGGVIAKDPCSIANDRVSRWSARPMKSSRVVAALVVVLAVCGRGSAQTAIRTAQPTLLAAGPHDVNTLVVIAAAPIFLLPDASREPLRVAKEGSALRAIERSGEWYNVEFQDPEYGRRVGYIQAKYVQVPATRGLEPVDVSVPEASRSEQPRTTTPVELPRAPIQPPSGRTAHNGMPTKYKVWGGILLGLSAYYFTSYAVTEPNRITCLFDGCYSTNTLRTIWLTMGIGLAGGGMAVLAVGAQNGRDASPSISISPRAVAVRETITVSRKRLRLWQSLRR